MLTFSFGRGGMLVERVNRVASGAMDSVALVDDGESRWSDHGFYGQCGSLFSVLGRLYTRVSPSEVESSFYTPFGAVGWRFFH